MIKKFCDRCGKECTTLFEIKIPCEKTSHGLFKTNTSSVCHECEKQYDNILDKLVDIRFIMFADFMKCGVQE